MTGGPAWEPIDVGEVRGVQLEILGALGTFCRAEGLAYFLYAGTLLGAVRHGGFIPWDDDIDVMMPRADYERFLERFAARGDLYVVHRGSRPDFPHPYAKVCRSGTLVDEHTRAAIPMGINVDVFPVDRLPSSRALYALQRWMFRGARALLLAKSLEDRSGRQAHKQVALVLGRLPLRPIPIRALTGLRERVATLFTRSRTHVGMLVTEVAWRVPSADLSPARYVQFEGSRQPIPAGTESLLTQIYGDYLTPPPAAARVNPHTSRYYREAPPLPEKPEGNTNPRETSNG